VASRWRIRHKLLLGLVLVVGIMALLLCGTLRGLWSNYTTTVTIRAKVHELVAAEEVRSAIAELIAPQNAIDLVRDHAKVDGQLRKVQTALTAYEEQLNDTLTQSRDPLNGEHEMGLVEDLRKHLEALEDAARKCSAPKMGAQSTEQDCNDALAATKKQRDQLCQSALDLRDHIKDELARRMGGESRSHYQVALWIIVPSSVLGLLFMAGLMRSFYAWVFYPIRDLEAGVGRVAQGDFRHRIELHSGDEMEDLANAFNDMSERLRELYDDLARQVNERSRQLVRSERLASVGFLAAGVAHEINNPLASIAFCSEALEARLGELIRHLRTPRASEEHDIFRKYLKMIQEEAFRCKTITERLLEFSRTGERRREERLGGRISAWVNGEEIKSVILNLVVNALESMDEGGRLTIRLSQRDGLAELRFTDSGCGMTTEVLENIFEPFFTRSRSGKGTGLGLTISHLIISQHGGEIEASSPGSNQGSTFIVRLPTQPTEAIAELTIGEDRPRAAEKTVPPTNRQAA
jgi:signal transduction histidine kinase